MHSARLSRGKLPRQNYFNLFVKNNFRKDSVKVYLTKEQKNAGTCVVAPYMISCGSLRTIGAEFVNGVYQSGISLPNLSIGASTTIGDFSTEVIRSNKVLNFKDGDKITFIAAKQCTRNDVPFAQVEQNWLTLDQQDTRILWQVVA